MHSLAAPRAPFVALDSVYCGRLSSERRALARALLHSIAVAPPPAPRPPFDASELALLGALGFLVASLLLNVAFA